MRNSRARDAAIAAACALLVGVVDRRVGIRRSTRLAGERADRLHHLIRRRLRCKQVGHVTATPTDTACSLPTQPDRRSLPRRRPPTRPRTPLFLLRRRRPTRPRTPRASPRRRRRTRPRTRRPTYADADEHADQHADVPRRRPRTRRPTRRSHADADEHADRVRRSPDRPDRGPRAHAVPARRARRPAAAPSTVPTAGGRRSSFVRVSASGPAARLTGQPFDVRRPERGREPEGSQLHDVRRHHDGDGKAADFSGTCTTTASPCTFTVHVEDNSEPGVADVIRDHDLVRLLTRRRRRSGAATSRSSSPPNDDRDRTRPRRHRRRRPVRARLRARARPARPRRLAVSSGRRGRRPRVVGRRPRRLHVGPRRPRRVQPLRRVRRAARRGHGRRRLRARALVLRPLPRPLGAVSVPEQPPLPRRRRTPYECLLGLVEAPGPDGDTGLRDAGWTGPSATGISRHFMRPYNAEGLGDAPGADVGDLDRRARQRRRLAPGPAQRRARRGRRRLGAEQHLPLPAAGGTGEIYRRLAATPRRAGPATSASSWRSTPCAASSGSPTGGARSYDALVSTMPLDLLVAAIVGCPARGPRGGRGARSTTACGGRRRLRAAARPTTGRWLYFPDAVAPVLPRHELREVRAGERPGRRHRRATRSYLTETCVLGPPAAAPAARWSESVIAGLVAAGLVDADAPVASVHTIDVEYAYPIPTLDRDARARRRSSPG